MYRNSQDDYVAIRAELDEANGVIESLKKDCDVFYEKYAARPRTLKGAGMTIELVATVAILCLVALLIIAVFAE
jgi:hypothetical protein